MVDIKELKTGQKIYYKSIYLFPVEMIIKEITYLSDNYTILFEDGTYASIKNLKDYFMTEKECVEVCKQELEDKLEILHLMLNKEK